MHALFIFVTATSIQGLGLSQVVNGSPQLSVMVRGEKGACCPLPPPLWEGRLVLDSFHWLLEGERTRWSLTAIISGQCPSLRMGGCQNSAPTVAVVTVVPTSTTVAKRAPATTYALVATVLSMPLLPGLPLQHDI